MKRHSQHRTSQKKKAPHPSESGLIRINFKKWEPFSYEPYTWSEEGGLTKAKRTLEGLNPRVKIVDKGGGYEYVVFPGEANITQDKSNPHVVSFQEMKRILVERKRASSTRKPSVTHSSVKKESKHKVRVSDKRSSSRRSSLKKPAKKAECDFLRANVFLLGSQDEKEPSQAAVVTPESVLNPKSRAYKEVVADIQQRVTEEVVSITNLLQHDDRFPDAKPVPIRITWPKPTQIQISWTNSCPAMPFLNELVSYFQDGAEDTYLEGDQVVYEDYEWVLDEFAFGKGAKMRHKWPVYWVENARLKNR